MEEREEILPINSIRYWLKVLMLLSVREERTLVLMTAFT